MVSKTRICLIVISAALNTACLGCSFLEDQSWGEKGVAQFAWDEGILGCLFGCDADEPMATRSVAMIQVVNDEDLPLFTATSDNPAVLDFIQDEPGDSLIRAESHMQGSAKLVLTSVESGDVIDRFRVRVRDVHSIRTNDRDLYTDRLTIMIGGVKRVYLDLDSEAGNELVGIGGVDYTLAGGISVEQVTLLSALEDLIISVLVGTVDEYVEVEALAVGSGTIDVMAPSGASLAIPAAVVDESAVTRVTLALEEEAVVGETAYVDATAWAGEERIWSPDCLWSLEPPDGPVTIDSEGGSSLSLDSASPATVTVTCTIGFETGVLTVSFR